MAWSTSADGFGKALLNMYQTTIQGKLSDLTACFAAQSSLAFLGTTYPALSSSSVIRGDYEQMWDIKTEGALKIYVSAGGNREGVSLTQKNFYIDQSTPNGKMRNYTTTVTCLFHQSAFNLLIANTQSTTREDAYQLVSDWLDWDVFGAANTNKILVPSKCHSNTVTSTNPNGYDFIYDNKITQCMKVFVQIAPANSATVTGIQAIITGYC